MEFLSLLVLVLLIMLVLPKIIGWAWCINVVAAVTEFCIAYNFVNYMSGEAINSFLTGILVAIHLFVWLTILLVCSNEKVRKLPVWFIVASISMMITTGVDMLLVVMGESLCLV